MTSAHRALSAALKPPEPAEPERAGNPFHLERADGNLKAGIVGQHRNREAKLFGCFPVHGANSFQQAAVQ